jgi:ABC-2 type transport system ATP-binding protein
LLQGLQAAGRTIVLTTHYLDEAEKLSDEVLVIHKGKEVAKATPKDLIEQYGGGKSVLLKDFDKDYTAKLDALGLSFVWVDGDVKIKLTAGESAKDVLDRLSAASVPMKDFSTIESTLEDAFINLVGGTIVSGEFTQ